MIHIYCGNGKGKTTAALGLCLRAKGRGKACLWTSFLKDYNSGEFMGELPFCLEQGQPVSGFVWEMNQTQLGQLSLEHTQRLNKIKNMAPEYQLIVLDEVFGAIQAKVLQSQDVLGFLHSLPPNIEVVLTGQNPPLEFVQLADYVSVIQAQKHPYQTGQTAREGVEF